MSELAASPVPVRASRPLERVESEIVSVASQLAAASARLLGLIGDYDAVDGWRDWGARSMAHWLSWKTGMSLGTAREQVRVARALRDLPLTAASFASGRLSYCKVRALSRIATAESESDLVSMAEHATGSQIETFVSAARRAVRASDVRARRRAAYLTWHHDDDGSIVGSFRLAPEQGAIVVQALDAASGRLRELPGEGDQPEEAATRRSRSTADAWEEMSRVYLDSVSAETSAEGAERYQLVLHTTAEELAKPDDADDDGQGSLLAGGAGRRWRIAPSTARRLTCDCPTSTMIDGPDGDALHLGRKTRRIRGRIRRAVMARDRGMCRAPGCTEPARQIHHLRHWAHGGSTCLGNLVSLCDGHHWLVHEGGFTLVRSDRGGWALISLDGVRSESHPEPFEPTAPLSYDPAVAPDAVSGRWDGTRMNAAYAVDVILGLEVPKQASKSRRSEDEDVSAETWEPIDWPVHDDYPDEPRTADDDWWSQ